LDFVAEEVFGFAALAVGFADAAADCEAAVAVFADFFGSVALASGVAAKGLEPGTLCITGFVAGFGDSFTAAAVSVVLAAAPLVPSAVAFAADSSFSAAFGCVAVD
jgi:hypothetical protein